MLLRCVLLLQLAAVTHSAGVKCFCDRESCDENLLCQGEFCFIGLRRDSDSGDSHRLRQHCGSGSDLAFLGGILPRCEERIDEWHEICTCTTDFCNTFAYLRSSIDSRAHTQDIVSFTKQDVPPSVHHSRPEVPAKNNNSSLVVLLVIIPLCVGGGAVLLSRLCASIYNVLSFPQLSLQDVEDS